MTGRRQDALGARSVRSVQEMRSTVSVVNAGMVRIPLVAQSHEEGGDCVVGLLRAGERRAGSDDRRRLQRRPSAI